MYCSEAENANGSRMIDSRLFEPVGGTMKYDSKMLAHFGILGMRWGIRRFQNPDGTLTKEGKQRYREHKLRSIEGLKDLTTEAYVENKEAAEELASLPSRNDLADSLKEEYAGFLKETMANSARSVLENAQLIDYNKAMIAFMDAHDQLTVDQIDKYSAQYAKENGLMQLIDEAFESEDRKWIFD